MPPNAPYVARAQVEPSPSDPDSQTVQNQEDLKHQKALRRDPGASVRQVLREAGAIA